MPGTLHEDLGAFIVISQRILLSMGIVSDKSCRYNQNTHFIFSNFYLKILPLLYNVENIC
jgi:hypothetical protein